MSHVSEHEAEEEAEAQGHDKGRVDLPIGGEAVQPHHVLEGPHQGEVPQQRGDPDPRVGEGAGFFHHEGTARSLLGHGLPDRVEGVLGDPAGEDVQAAHLSSTLAEVVDPLHGVDPGEEGLVVRPMVRQKVPSRPGEGLHRLVVLGDASLQDPQGVLRVQSLGHVPEGVFLEVHRLQELLRALQVPRHGEHQGPGVPAPGTQGDHQQGGVLGGLLQALEVLVGGPAEEDGHELRLRQVPGAAFQLFQAGHADPGGLQFLHFFFQGLPALLPELQFSCRSLDLSGQAFACERIVQRYREGVRHRFSRHLPDRSQLPQQVVVGVGGLGAHPGPEVPVAQEQVQGKGLEPPHQDHPTGHRLHLLVGADEGQGHHLHHCHGLSPPERIGRARYTAA